MKKLILLFFFTIFLTPKIYPQFWIENFEYPDGDTLAYHWRSIAPLGVEYMRITSPGLTTEPAPTLGPKGGPDPDMDNIGVFDLFKNGNPLGAIVDGIYVNGSWNNATLPVELSSFNSTVNTRDVILNWSTVSEINNSGFEVERVNTKEQTQNEWINAGFVQGHGTSTNPFNYLFKDKDLNSGKYKYRLKQIDLNGNYKYYELQNEIVIGAPEKFSLSQNYPNPFNPTTKINYDIPSDGKVSLRIFDMSGKEVMTLVNEFQTAGYYNVNFNAGSLSSGIYFYRLTAQSGSYNFVNTKKMVIVK